MILIKTVQYDMAYSKYIDLTRETQSEKNFKDKPFKIASNLSYRYERGLALMFYKFVDKKYTSFADKPAKGTGIKSMPNQQLASELHKLISKKYKIRRVYFPFRDIISGVHLADMETIRKFEFGIHYVTLFFLVNMKTKKGLVKPVIFITVLL